MENNIEPIHLVAQELSAKTIELAQFKVAYETLYKENQRLSELEMLVNNNVELKELVEEIKNKGE